MSTKAERRDRTDRKVLPLKIKVDGAVQRVNASVKEPKPARRFRRAEVDRYTEELYEPRTITRA